MDNPDKRSQAQIRSPSPVAYVAQSFPDLTQTFVYREVEALERLGIPVATFSIWRKPVQSVSMEARPFFDRTFYVFPLSRFRFFFSHLGCLLSHPVRYGKTLCFVLSRPGQPHRNRVRTFYHFCYAVYMAGEMRRRGVRHIHAHFSLNAATVALAAARLLKISFSFTAHNIVFRENLILREKIREAGFIASISDYTRRYLIEIDPRDEVRDKIHIIRCGIDPDRFSPPPGRQPKEVPVLLFVAQLTEKKGAPVLLRACGILKNEGIPFQCVVAGDGPQAGLLNQMVRDLDLSPAVRLAGRIFQEDLRGYLEEADIFVLPSVTTADGDRDGIPVSLMEAMAMEIPCVSTYVSGIPELIENGRTGLLVEEKNPSALAEALKKLLVDEELRSRLGRLGRERIIDEFDVEKNAGKLKALFERYIQDSD